MSFCKESMRRIVATLLVLMTISTFIIAPAYADEEPGEPAQYYGVVQASTLNVRESASMDSDIISVLSMGTYVKVNWLEPGWVSVAYNHDGLMGYVSSDYISVYEGEMPEYDPTSGQAVIDIASKYLGVPYVYGGTTPSGFDCSGLVQYVYRELGYNLNRVAADQMNNGIAVSRDQLQPGDLIGFYSSAGGGYIGHIGIYAGNGMMIHAPRTGDVVKYASIESSYYTSRYAGARRIIY